MAMSLGVQGLAEFGFAFGSVEVAPSVQGWCSVGQGVAEGEDALINTSTNTSHTGLPLRGPYKALKGPQKAL